METLGVVFLVILAILAVVLIGLFIFSLNDLARYRRVRRM